MNCYFGAYKYPQLETTGKTAVVMFHIPDVGIRFKAPFQAVSDDHSDYASLLALLEFIDSNQKYFSNRAYQIFGNNARVINQINGRETFPPEFEALVDKARQYREKYHFSLQWVPSQDNTVYDSLLH
jgi:hypothetical protein